VNDSKLNLLLQERAELHTRLEKLQRFIETREFDSLNKEDQVLLCKQELDMEQDEKTLSNRIFYTYLNASIYPDTRTSNLILSLEKS
jgi:hypothetical protein